MKITVIYGNDRKGSTYNSVQLFKEKLNEHGAIDYIDIFLPADLSEFCRGCFNCILKREETCPDSEQVESIVKKMLSADGIILASPVYALDVSGSMKNLLDHLCYMWMPHRPRNQPAKFYKATLNREKLWYRLKIRAIFLVMKRLVKIYENANLDRAYWEKQGWFDGNSPF